MNTGTLAAERPTPLSVKATNINGIPWLDIRRQPSQPVQTKKDFSEINRREQR